LAKLCFGKASMKIVVAGATGFVGKRLVERLLKSGDRASGNEVIILARDPQKALRQFPPLFFPKVEVVGYTPQVLGDWQQVCSRAEAIINLAGTPIAGNPWTDATKKDILLSRQLSTKVLVEAIAAANPRPKVLINGSAIGFYGTDLTKEFDEYSYAGKDFLAGVCQAWEFEADKASSLGVRVVKLRTGLVLGNGGILEKILPLFQLGVGGKLGSGKQWFSWIHRDDLISLIEFLLNQSQLSGAYNGTAPHPVTNAEFTQALAQAIVRPAFLPVPEFVLQLALGESAILALEGQKVLPKKAEIAGFKFQYRQIGAALAQILSS
jgi:uncharacterized protein